MTDDNLGFGRGHNVVLSRLDSRYHAIVNADVLLTEDSFSKIISFMDKTDCGMCVPRIVDEKGKLQQVYRRQPTLFDYFIRMFCKGGFAQRRAYHTIQEQNYQKAFQVPFAQGSFLVIRTELFKKLEGFDDRYFMYMEDADLCKRVNDCSCLMYCPDTSIIHKWEKGSHKNVKLLLYHLHSIWLYFHK